MTAIAGVYPVVSRASLDDEAELWAALAAEPLIAGIELPYSDGLHRAGPEWVAAHLPAHWTVVITAIPGTMSALQADPVRGLASADPGGRQRALADVAAIAAAGGELNALLGRGAVSAVELHSAPRGGTADALRDSLERALALDWQGAAIALEHCDAAVAGHEPAKGFLPLEAELRALDGLPMGVVINWARSAIELRDADRVTEHLTLARDAGRLAGLMLSGVAPVATEYGESWADAHLPHIPASLLTPERAAAAVAAAGEVAIRGAKVSWKGEATTAARVAAVLDTVRMLVPADVASR